MLKLTSGFVDRGPAASDTRRLWLTRHCARKARIAVTIIGVALVLPLTPAGAQTPTPATAPGAERLWTLFATGGAAFQHDSPDLDGRSIGAELDWAPAEMWSARVGYRYRTFDGGGAALHMANGGAGMRLPIDLPGVLRAIGHPRARVEAIVARGAALSAGDHYENLTVPVSLGLGRTFGLGRTSIALLAAGQAIFARSDMRLFGFEAEEQDIGAGAEIEATIRRGAFLARMNARVTNMDPDLGPQPLGNVAFELAIGLGL